MTDSSDRDGSERRQRHAEARRAAFARREVEAGRRFRKPRTRRPKSANPDELARLKQELADLVALRTASRNPIGLKLLVMDREIAALRRMIAVIEHHRRRKPPEAGISIPAVPPSGPKPKSGGAEAPLEFDQ